jgi:hypothetical protein
MKPSVFPVLAFLLAEAVAAGASDSWTALLALSPGEHVRVQTASERHEGTLTGKSATGITITPATGGPVAVERADVQRVFVRTKSHRLRNAIIGTAIGVAAGAVLYGTLGSWFRNEGRDDTSWMLAAPIGIGAGVSAALPTGAMRKIYEKRP